MSDTTSPRRDDDRVLLAVALAVMVLHNIDEAFVHPEKGGRVSLATVAAMSVMLIAFYPRIGHRVRIVILTLWGVISVAAGFAGHLVHFLSGDPSGSDPSGILFVMAGGVLIWLALRELRHPAEPIRDQQVAN